MFTTLLLLFTAFITFGSVNSRWVDCSTYSHDMKFKKVTISVTKMNTYYLYEISYTGTLTKEVTSGNIYRNVYVDNDDIPDLEGQEALCSKNSCPVEPGDVKGDFYLTVPLWVKHLEGMDMTMKVTAYDQDSRLLFCLTGDLDLELKNEEVEVMGWIEWFKAKMVNV